ncbi:MAG: hypothetical protein U1F43_30370 [Myxococcota bacterium]
MGDLDEAVVTAFVGRVAPERRPLGWRFAEHLEARFPGRRRRPSRASKAASLLRAAGRRLRAALEGGTRRRRPRWRWPRAWRSCAPSDVATIVLSSAANASPGPHSWLVRRDAAEEVGLTAVTEATADLLARLPLPEAEIVVDVEIGALIDEGFLVPDAWGLEVEAAPG